MYKIENRNSGYILTFSGTITEFEMQRWHDDSERQLNGESRSTFGVIIDMKELKPLSAEAKEIMIAGQKLYKDKGMKRSAVIVNNDQLASQFKNLAIQSGIYSTERYIDASSNTDYKEAAISWVKDAVDPDK